MKRSGDLSTAVIVKLLPLRRRDVLCFGGFVLLSTTFGSAVRAEGDASADAAAGQSSTINDSAAERPDTTTSDLPGETDHAEQRPADLHEQLGLSLRAPQFSYEDRWSIMGEFGGSPDRFSQRPSAFSVDNANQSLMNPEGSPLDTALRCMLPAVSEASVTSDENTRRLSGPTDSVKESQPSKILQALKSVEWVELGSATLDKAGEIAVDYTKDFTLERIAEALGTQAMNRAFGYFSLVIDVIRPEMINGGHREELTYLDRMSPAERRDFYQELMTIKRVQLPTTLQPTGPTLRAP